MRTDGSRYPKGTQVPMAWSSPANTLIFPIPLRPPVSAYLHQPFPVRPHWAWPCTFSLQSRMWGAPPTPNPTAAPSFPTPHSRHLSPHTSAPSADLGVSSSENRLLPTPLAHGLQGPWVSEAHLLLPFVQGSQVCTAYRPMITLSSKTVLALWLFKAGVYVCYRSVTAQGIVCLLF